MISSTPDAAYEICTEYCPPCNKAFMYTSGKFSHTTIQPKQERLNATTQSSKSKESKHGKKKKKNFQALAGQYSTVDGSPARNYEEFDDEYYEESDDEDEENQNKDNLSYSTPEMNVISVTRQPIYDNNVGANL